MAAEPRRSAEGFSRDVALMRIQFRETIPAYEAILGHVQDMLERPDAPLRQALDRAWEARTFHVNYDRPLLFLAALRADALTEGPSHPLFGAIGPEPVTKQVLAAAVEQSLGADRPRFFAMLGARWVQTNETLRSVAWRWPAWLAGCEGRTRSLALVDLGASAGLNLVADRLPAVWTDEAGALLPVVHAVNAVIRLGLDARPLDLGDPDAVTWMRACIWPGDQVRLARFELALQAFRDARDGGDGPRLETHDVGAFAARVARVSREAPSAFVLAYQSYLRDYLPVATRDAYRAAMHAWLASIAPGAGLWVELEAAKSEDDRPPSALTVHLRLDAGAVRTLELARTFHHPQRLTANPPALAAVEQALRPSLRST